MEGNRSSDNCYLLASPNTCLNTVQNDHILWHRRLGHIIHNNLKDIIASEAFKVVSNLKAEPESMCAPCQLRIQTRMSNTKSQITSTSRVLELIHMDLMGPMQVESLAGKRCKYVCVDEFSRFSWTNFCKDKSKACKAFEELWLKLAKEHNKVLRITKIRSDYGKVFENSFFKNFGGKNGIQHEFSAFKTP